jgi:hypothetical protein
VGKPGKEKQSMVDEDMLNQNVHFKGYIFKHELYPFDTKVVGKNATLFLVDHPNGYPKEIDGVKRLVIQVRKEDLEIL